MMRDEEKGSSRLIQRKSSNEYVQHHTDLYLRLTVSESEEQIPSSLACKTKSVNTRVIPLDSTSISHVKGLSLEYGSGKSGVVTKPCDVCMLISLGAKT